MEVDSPEALDFYSRLDAVFQRTATKPTSAGSEDLDPGRRSVL